MTVRFRGHSLESKDAIKYLGVMIDPKLHFREHAETVARRASETCRQLTQMLPNLRGPRQRTRRVLATVVTSRLLYGTPFWSPSITTEAMNKMSTVYRRLMLRVACSYRTVSHEAAAVVSSMPPLRLLAEERCQIYDGTDKHRARDQLLTSWQNEWVSAEKGRWTFRLIKDVKRWYKRQHGEVSFHLCQMLTGHGCFGEYLHRFGKIDSDCCALCGYSPDDAGHAIFECDAFHRWRTEACVYLGIDRLSPDNLVDIMLRSNTDWLRVAALVGRIMVTWEREERARQQAPGGARLDNMPNQRT